MPDREKVIKGLEICTSRPCYCTDCPYKKECCVDSQNVMEDALALLKEQENEIADKAITVDVSIPEQFWPSMRYDPSEDVVACTSCLICGKAIPLRRYESGPRVCSECKEAVTAMKRGD